MPPLEHMDFHDRAMLWTISRHDKHGDPILSEPEEICCRWEEGETELRNPEGQDLVIDVVMSTNRKLTPGSLLWEGSEEDLEDEVGTGLTPERDIYEVLFRIRGKDLKGRVTRYEFALKRFKDELPVVQDG